MGKNGLRRLDGGREGTGKPLPTTRLCMQSVNGTPEARPEQTSDPIRLSVGATLGGVDLGRDPKLHRIQVMIGLRVETLVCLGNDRGKLLWKTVKSMDEVRTTPGGIIIGIRGDYEPRILLPLTKDEIPKSGEILQELDLELSPFEQVFEIRGRVMVATELSWESILWEDQWGQLTVMTDHSGRVKMGFADM